MSDADMSWEDAVSDFNLELLVFTGETNELASVLFSDMAEYASDGGDERRITDTRFKSSLAYLHRKLDELPPSPTLHQVLQVWFTSLMRLYYGERILFGVSVQSQQDMYSHLLRCLRGVPGVELLAALRRGRSVHQPRTGKSLFDLFPDCGPLTKGEPTLYKRVAEQPLPFVGSVRLYLDMLAEQRNSSTDEHILWQLACSHEAAVAAGNELLAELLGYYKIADTSLLGERPWYHKRFDVLDAGASFAICHVGCTSAGEYRNVIGRRTRAGKRDLDGKKSTNTVLDVIARLLEPHMSVESRASDESDSETDSCCSYTSGDCSSSDWSESESEDEAMSVVDDSTSSNGAQQDGAADAQADRGDPRIVRAGHSEYAFKREPVMVLQNGASRTQLVMCETLLMFGAGVASTNTLLVAHDSKLGNHITLDGAQARVAQACAAAAKVNACKRPLHDPFESCCDHIEGTMDASERAEFRQAFKAHLETSFVDRFVKLLMKRGWTRERAISRVRSRLDERAIDVIIDGVAPFVYKIDGDYYVAHVLVAKEPPVRMVERSSDAGCKLISEYFTSPGCAFLMEQLTTMAAGVGQLPNGSTGRQLLLGAFIDMIPTENLLALEREFKGGFCDAFLAEVAGPYLKDTLQFLRPSQVVLMSSQVAYIARNEFGKASKAAMAKDASSTGGVFKLSDTRFELKVGDDSILASAIAHFGISNYNLTDVCQLERFAMALESQLLLPRVLSDALMTSGDLSLSDARAHSQCLFSLFGDVDSQGECSNAN
jgi:hypothetical protein